MSVGNELVEGKVVDTNSAYISKKLMQCGFTVFKHISIPDIQESITSEFRKAAKGQVGLVVATGGLGPTVDDMTKECLADAFGKELVFDETAWEQLTKRFMKFGKIPTENNRKQAMLPKDCVPFYNSCGTAPGLALKAHATHFCIMPGIPREMKAMVTESLLPYIEKTFGFSEPRIERYFRTFGIGESNVGRLLQDMMQRDRNPRIDLTVQEGIITVKLTASSGTSSELLERDMQSVRELLKGYIWTEENMPFEEHIINNLEKHQYTIALAESCTGGLASAGLVSVPGCSNVLLESVVAYANYSKMKRLGVGEETIETFGAVSEETVREMAQGVRKTSGADIGAGVTGIAGPGGGTEEKPVGLVWFAVAAGNYLKTVSRIFHGNREYVRTRSVSQLYFMIHEYLLDSGQ